MEEIFGYLTFTDIAKFIRISPIWHQKFWKNCVFFQRELSKRWNYEPVDSGTGLGCKFHLQLSFWYTHLLVRDYLVRQCDIYETISEKMQGLLTHLIRDECKGVILVHECCRLIIELFDGNEPAFYVREKPLFVVSENVIRHLLWAMESVFQRRDGKERGEIDATGIELLHVCVKVLGILALLGA